MIHLGHKVTFSKTISLLLIKVPFILTSTEQEKKDETKHIIVQDTLLSYIGLKTLFGIHT